MKRKAPALCPICYRDSIQFRRNTVASLDRFVPEPAPRPISKGAFIHGAKPSEVTP